MPAGAEIRLLLFLLFLLFLLLPVTVTAATPGERARQIAGEVYFVNHFFAVDNISYGSKRKPMELINLPAGGKAQRYRLERHLNNVYDKGDIRALDLVIFRSGKLRSTGILVDIYRDRKRPLSFAIWLPALRKIRRHSEPDPADIWGGSIFTYGDIYLRRPEDENHTLLGKIRFPDCLGMLDPVPDGLEPSCEARGKEVYHLRSVNRSANWWYDCRAEYYRDGKLIKVIDKDWRSMELADPRAQYWRYWYGRDLRSGGEGLAWVKEGQVSWNDRVSRNLWSLATLRKLSR